MYAAWPTNDASSSVIDFAAERAAISNLLEWFGYGLRSLLRHSLQRSSNNRFSCKARNQLSVDGPLNQFWALAVVIPAEFDDMAMLAHFFPFLGRHLASPLEGTATGIIAVRGVPAGDGALESSVGVAVITK